MATKTDLPYATWSDPHDDAPEPVLTRESALTLIRGLDEQIERVYALAVEWDADDDVDGGGLLALVCNGGHRSFPV